LADDNGLLEDLRQAFGKNGLPAMIIETVVPELERSANELLGRMTEGRMQVRIKTLREIKSGELREALDIIISDELGTRPYDTYSGGESFRINFAIRIAISKLLARRAGAQLRSLFIDEGFGSQDAKGREQLVAAINSIQDDFDLILVITHIEEMKDAFPARIEVTKTATGSQFHLS
jgi:exonuclease SbcC